MFWGRLTMTVQYGEVRFLFCITMTSIRTYIQIYKQPAFTSAANHLPFYLTSAQSYLKLTQYKEILMHTVRTIIALFIK